MSSRFLQLPVLQRLSAVVVVVYAIFLAWLSLTPLAPTTAVSDKFLHVSAYGLFMMLTAPIALARSLRSLVLLAAGIFLYGACLEAAQALVPGRYPSGLDLLANAAGVLLAAGVLAVLRLAGAVKTGDELLEQ